MEYVEYMNFKDNPFDTMLDTVGLVYYLDPEKVKYETLKNNNKNE